MIEFVADGETGVAQGTWFGKMSPEPLAQTAGETSPPSSRKRSGSRSRKRPLCLCLRADGPRRESYTMSWADGALLGEFMIRSFGECPSEENGSRLSQILQASGPEKYYLSAEACRGILTRAARRGKELPEALREALEEQAKH